MNPIVLVLALAAITAVYVAGVAIGRRTERQQRENRDWATIAALAGRLSVRTNPETENTDVI